MSDQTARGAAPSKADIAAAIEARLDELGVTRSQHSAFIGEVRRAVVWEMRAGLAHWNDCSITDRADDLHLALHERLAACRVGPAAAAHQAISGALRGVPGVADCHVTLNMTTAPMTLVEEPLLELPPACACVVVLTADHAPLTVQQRHDVTQILGNYLPRTVGMIGSEEAVWTGHDSDQRIVRWFDRPLGRQDSNLARHQQHPGS